ncbi:uncharacterized protein LOC107807525 [Nicotiana tabacum]|uniref:Uncharacterized protein LOC107807525 n=1 Tax=Nicotiana tabacum TaxID=4097 RepID=A0A1S4BF09_TOBAC|nr:PREDICTED: uncharacterized protein LOC107807525 [Nicotiana tabacum]
MDALWNLEDKWKLSTQESVAFLVCTCSLVIGVCIVTAFIKRRAANRRKGLVSQEPCMDIEWSEPKLLSLSSTTVKKVLKSSVRWSSASKWEEKRSRSHTERISPLLVAEDQLEGDSYRWQSHNSDSPVWQRPVLMGEKCQTKSVTPLSVVGGQLEGDSCRWHSDSSNSSVWQRSILMGEKLERVSPLHVFVGQLEGDSDRYQSHNSISHVWQGPILMGDKCQTEKVSSLPVAGGQLEGDSFRWQSHNSNSHVWQRPILMGEKCELPRFSGLILYDERGRPVHHVDNDQFSGYQEKADAVGRTTLRDLF